jgi:hypothetical protein
MARDFEELDHCHTPIGELSFAPRKDRSFDVDVFDDKLGDRGGNHDIERARRRGTRDYPRSEMQMTETAPEFINRLRQRLELEPHGFLSTVQIGIPALGLHSLRWPEESRWPHQQFAVPTFS